MSVARSIALPADYPAIMRRADPDRIRAAQEAGEAAKGRQGCWSGPLPARALPPATSAEQRRVMLAGLSPEMRALVEAWDRR